jgi:hypothetical protein
VDKFGHFEMKEFAEQSDDPRVKAMWRRIVELRSKCARWCEAVNQRDREIERLKGDRDAGL